MAKIILHENETYTGILQKIYLNLKCDFHWIMNGRKTSIIGLFSVYFQCSTVSNVSLLFQHAEWKFNSIELRAKQITHRRVDEIIFKINVNYESKFVFFNFIFFSTSSGVVKYLTWIWNFEQNYLKANVLTIVIKTHYQVCNH